MKTKRYFGALLLTLFLTATVGMGLGASAKTVALRPTEAFFVNDYAGVLPAETEKVLMAKGRQLFEKTTAQAVVVTVDSLNGEAIEDYSYDLANAWGLGDAEQDNGLLLLLAVEDRQIRIEVGSGLEGRLNDAKTGRLLDHYAIPYLRENEYADGLAETYTALVNEVYLEYGMTADEDYVPVEDLEDENDIVGSVPLVVILVVVLVLIRIFGGPFSGLFIGGRGGFPGAFGGGGGFSGGRGGFSGGGDFSGGGGGFSGGGSSRGF